VISVAIAMGISEAGFISAGLSGLCPDGRQTAPYSPELELATVLTQPHDSGVDETLHTLW
jgi:hypothetical protein